jgi:hypothetical protein
LRVLGDQVHGSATFTPTAGTASANASITVAAGSYTDAAGNNGGAGSTPAISIDTLAPTLAITSSAAAVKSGETAAITFTFSEAPTGFVAGDVATTGGALSGFAVTANPKVYSATFTPTPGTAAANAGITVAAGAYTDAAGNSGGAGGTPAISIDTLAPTLAITSSTIGVKIGGTATITFSFSEAPVGFVAGDVATTGGTLSNFTVTADPKVYTATFTPPPNTASGIGSVSVAAASYSDAAGNPGGAGASPNIGIDTVAPSISLNPITGDNVIGVAEYTGAVAITGTTTGAEDGRTVTVHLNNHAYTGTVNSGVWSVTVPAGDVGLLTDHSTYPVTADVSDLAGNPATQASQNVLIAATGPVIQINAISGDNYINATEHGSGTAISGTVSGADGRTLTVHLNGQAYTSTVTAGTWSVSVDAAAITGLVDGTYPVTADVSDSSGNPAQQASRTLTVDTTIATPTVALAHDTGSSNSDGLTNDASLTLSPAAGDVSRTFTVDGGAASGTYTAPSTDGAHTVLVTDTDTAHNTANASLSFTLDKTLVTPSVALAHDTGSSGIDRITMDAGLTFSAAAGDVTRSFTVDGGAASGSYTAPSAGGSHTVVVSDTDTAGNSKSASLTFTLDTTIATPTVALAHDNGSSSSDGLTNDASLSLSPAAADVSRTFAVDGGVASSTYTAPSTDGSHTVLVTDTDTAGNTASASVSFTLDKTLVTPSVALTHDTGGSGIDRITNDASLTVSAAAGDVTRSFTVDGGAASGSYTAPSTDGSHTVVVTDTDNAGNSKSASLTFTRDTIAPTTAVSAVHLSNDTGSNSSDFYTSTAAQTISGTLSTALLAGDILKGSVDNGAHWTDITSMVSGTAIAWSGATLAGSDTIAFQVTDQAGNVVAATGTNAYTLDTTAPSFSSGDTATFADQGSGTAYTAVASDASAVSYSLAGSDAGQFNIDANSGAVSFKTPPSHAAPTDTGADNVYNFSVVATDLAGLATTHAVAISVVLPPALQASALDNVINFEVTSNIVLNYDQAVTAVAGKFIHLVNDGGAGFRGESSNHTQLIDVTGTSQVSIVGGKITINPSFDLDLSNNYHISIDAGAFTSNANHLATTAFDGTTSLNFSTVTPDPSRTLANAAASLAMDSSGAMVDGHHWLDIEGIGSSSNASGTPLDLSTSNFALVSKDYDSGAPNPDTSYNGIAVGDSYLALSNFGVNDLIYFDDQANNPATANDLSLSIIGNNGTAPSTLQLAGTGSGLGSFIDITLAGTSVAFDSVAGMQAALLLSTPPIISG